jgi:hypothetical protein
MSLDCLNFNMYQINKGYEYQDYSYQPLHKRDNH